MRRRWIVELIATGMILGSATSVCAAASIAFEIKAGGLTQALIELGRQAHITIGVTDPRVAAVRSPGVHGRMTLRSALERMLTGTGFTYVMTPGSVRIVKDQPKRPPQPQSPRITEETNAKRQDEDIIVTASKRDVRLSRFGGTVHVIELNSLSGNGGEGTEAILDLLPVLASTHLGPGRDKIYVRGVADSSFNGPSQSVVGLYLGDVRLTYNAPDPDLALYDVDRIELLEGPQGTLYGTGSLGGVLRLVPNRPDLGHFAGFLSAAGITTAHGGLGGDASGMLNMPLVKGRIALRAVAYGSTWPGFIDDTQLNLHDINRTKISGWRAALRVDAGNGWDVEFGGLAQDIGGRDGQYALSTLPPLTREASVRQPFDNDYRLDSVTVRKRFPEFELVSATGVVRHQLESRFDATGFPGTIGPQIFAESIDISMISHESRLSHSNSRGEGWLAGISFVHDVDEISRELGHPGSLAPISRLRNEFSEAALFGQVGLTLAPWAVLTVGGRVTYNKEEGGLRQDSTNFDEPTRRMVRLSPGGRMTFQLSKTAVAYVRYERAHRAGGIAVAEGALGPSVRRFETDSLSSLEAGVRIGQLARTGYELSTSVSNARWNDVQADLIDATGLPFTTNLGDGRIRGLEIEAAWRPITGLTFEVATFLNDSDLHRSDSAGPLGGEGDFPNVADVGGRASVGFEKRLGSSVLLGVSSSVRYVGKSRLGIGAPLDSKQGGYAVGDVGARLSNGQTGITLGVTNVGDIQGNQFSLGNPFSLSKGNQITPLRPRTIRLGIDRAL
jgi:iron complex outermembrane receptor protein